MRRIDVKKQRDRLGVSQSWLARRLGVSMSTLRAWEHARSQPMAGYLPDLAEILECSIEDLYEPKGSDRGVGLVLVEGQSEIPW